MNRTSHTTVERQADQPRAALGFLSRAVRRVLKGFVALAVSAVLLAGLSIAGGGCAAKPAPVPPKAWEEAERLSRQAARLQTDGDWAGAVVWWERAARQFQLLNDRTNLAVAHHNLGVVRRSLGRPDDARRSLQEAARINTDLGQTQAWWRNQIALLQIANDGGGANPDPDAAALLERFDREPVAPAGDALNAVLAHERARAWLNAGRLDDALLESTRAVGLFERAGDPAGQATARVLQARILRRLGRLDDSVALWVRVLGEFELQGNIRGVAVALAGWGGSLAEEGRDLRQAVELLERAEANYRALGATKEAEAVAAERAAVLARSAQAGQ
jgi:tetratricopeptide (TPR) repeat protein